MPETKRVRVRREKRCRLLGGIGCDAYATLGTSPLADVFSDYMRPRTSAFYLVGYLQLPISTYLVWNGDDA